MAWPSKISEVTCVNFHRCFLPHLKRAIDSKQVKWNHNLLFFINASSGQFEYKGCLFEIEEWNETVTSITLLKGNIVEALETPISKISIKQIKSSLIDSIPAAEELAEKLKSHFGRPS